MLPPDKKAAQVQEFTRRFPVLAELPEGERMAVVRQAAFHPSVWGTALLVMAVLFPLLAQAVFYLQDRHALRAIAVLGILFLAVLLPIVLRMQGRMIKKIVARRRQDGRTA